MNAISVLIVDDHPLFRRGIRTALDSEPGIHVIADVGSAGEAMAVCRAEPPDVVVLDVNLPDRSGIEVAREMREECPGVGVLILSAYDDERIVLAAADAGADGYLLKDSTDDEISRAVRAVASGESVFATRVTRTLLRRARGEVAPAYGGLTERERDVLRAVAVGGTNRQVGHDLGISERTVQAHLSHIFGKLGATSRTEAVTIALREGYVTLADERASDDGDSASGQPSN